MRKAALIPDLTTLHNRETNKRVLEQVVEGDDGYDDFMKEKIERERDELLQKKEQLLNDIERKKYESKTNQIDENKSQLTKYYFRYSDSFILKWDIAVIILAIWNCFSIPLDISFEPPFSLEVFYLIIDSCIDLFFVCDVIV